MDAKVVLHFADLGQLSFGDFNRKGSQVSRQFKKDLYNEIKLLAPYSEAILKIGTDTDTFTSFYKN